MNGIEKRLAKLEARRERLSDLSDDELESRIREVGQSLRAQFVATGEQPDEDMLQMLAAADIRWEGVDAH